MGEDGNIPEALLNIFPPEELREIEEAARRDAYNETGSDVYNETDQNFTSRERQGNYTAAPLS